jgi:hypothetical protein
MSPNNVEEEEGKDGVRPQKKIETEKRRRKTNEEKQNGDRFRAA